MPAAACRQAQRQRLQVHRACLPSTQHSTLFRYQIDRHALQPEALPQRVGDLPQPRRRQVSGARAEEQERGRAGGGLHDVPAAVKSRDSGSAAAARSLQARAPAGRGRVGPPPVIQPRVELLRALLAACLGVQVCGCIQHAVDAPAEQALSD